MGGMSQERRSAEERQRLLKEFESSGQTRRQFCEQHGLAITTLDSWRRGRKRRPRFVKVEIPAPAGGPGFALVLANGRRIECSWSFEEAGLARLIRAAEA
jgi:hypothetical protein